MRARATFAALLALGVLLLAGCGGDDGKRDAIGLYFDRVNAVQSAMSKPLLEVSKANRDFAQGKGNAAKVRDRLARSERTLATLRRRLARIEPPTDAKPMQELLLELIDRERGLARETRQLAQFIPAFGTALAPVGPAGKTLKKELDGTGSADAKATALERYGAAVSGVLLHLRPLQPPPSSEPVYEAQVRTLLEVRAAVTDLAAALRERRTDDIGPLLHRFDVAAIANQSLAAQRAQVAAVKAYNSRVHGLDELATKIARERLRLQKLVG
jgi:hypothetical protein